MAAPLNTLHKKGVKFVWGQEQKEAFEALKQAISHPPVLRVADISKMFILQTDASGVTLGGCFPRKVTVLDSLLRIPQGR